MSNQTCLSDIFDEFLPKGDPVLQEIYKKRMTILKPEYSNAIVAYNAYKQKAIEAIEEESFIFYPKENVIPPIEKVIFNPPATIVFWDDGEKTVVKCKESEEFDYECGLAMAIAKRYFGSRSKFKKAIGKAEKITSDSDSDMKSLGYYMLGYKSKNSSDIISFLSLDSNSSDITSP